MGLDPNKSVADQTWAGTSGLTTAQLAQATPEVVQNYVKAVKERATRPGATAEDKRALASLGLNPTYFARRGNQGVARISVRSRTRMRAIPIGKILTRINPKTGITENVPNEYYINGKGGFEDIKKDVSLVDRDGQAGSVTVWPKITVTEMRDKVDPVTAAPSM